MKGGAVFFYDVIAQWGLQDPKVLLNPAIVQANRGIGLADMIIMVPLFIIAVIGLLRLRFYGAVASWLALGITLYWPIVFLSCQYFFGIKNVKYKPTDISTLLILVVLLFCAGWASWYLYKIRKKLY